MRHLLRFTIGLILISVLESNCAAATALFPPIPDSTDHVELKTIATGLTAPVYLTSAGDGSGRLFVADQVGKISIITPGQPGMQTFLDLSSTITPLMPNYDERGLWGLAFSPGFANPASPGFHKLYTYQTEPTGPAVDFGLPPNSGTGTPDHDNVLTEWTVSAANPNQVDTSTRRQLLRFSHPEFNHNGGTLAFGPDANLYLSSGDGGNANDTGFGHQPGGNAQATNTPLGKVLRIDPLGHNSANGQYGIPAGNPFNGTNGLAEIYAYGLRNPYRMSFDHRPGGSGQLIVADVGQNNVEEVNNNVTAGGNYGWNTKEGTYTFDPTTGNVIANSPGSPAGLIDPLAEYDHTQGIAVIGGFVYRGSAIASLAGKYIFGDLSTSFTAPNGHLFEMDLATGQIQRLLIGGIPRDLGLFLKGFGEDANGELYVLGSTALGPSGTTGVVLQIVPVPEPVGWAVFAMLAAMVGLLRTAPRNASVPAAD